MSKSSRCVIAAVAALALDTPSLEAQKKLPALDAEIDSTYTLADGRQFSTHGHYYRSQHGQLREDSPLGAIITDIKSGTITMLNFETKEAHVVKVSAEPRASKPKSLAPPVSFEKATVDGRQVTKARTQNDRGETQEFWTAKDLGLVVFSKVTSPSLTMAKSLRKVSLREPDPSVFTVPKGYTVTKHDSPAAVPRPYIPVPPATSSSPPGAGQ